MRNRGKPQLNPASAAASCSDGRHDVRARALGLHGLDADFGGERRIALRTDASTAAGIMQRRGAGKFKHIIIIVQGLWLHGVVRDGRAELRKLPGR